MEIMACCLELPMLFLFGFYAKHPNPKARTNVKRNYVGRSSVRVGMKT